MSATSLEVIRWGSERARSAPWRGDGRVAHLAPVADSRPLSTRFVTHCTERLAGEGYTRVVTAALAPIEQTGFLEAGFEVEQRLHLLAHDMKTLPERPANAPGLRRARRSDLDAVIAVDNDAFDAFWSMDRVGIDEALTATPRSRFRVAVGPGGNSGGGGGVIGYAITGRAGRRGYLQRLAVAGSSRGRGTGRALVADGLGWLARWRVDRCLVNTQVGNERALALYESIGFRPEPTGLSVLSFPLPS